MPEYEQIGLWEVSELYEVMGSKPQWRFLLKKTDGSIHHQISADQREQFQAERLKAVAAIRKYGCFLPDSVEA